MRFLTKTSDRKAGTFIASRNGCAPFLMYILISESTLVGGKSQLLINIFLCRLHLDLWPMADIFP